VLALAPTGSGKTLTAFLAALSRFAEGVYPAGRLSALYVSPLKALNEDIRRNLLEPVAALRSRFDAAGAVFPEISAETRSGDTPQAARRRFLIKPPSILALTPESLAILLLNPRGREVLSGVRYVILDEIHALLGNKRGSFLACQIDRLALIAGEFQRIGLSATVRPAETAAEFTGGLKAAAPGGYEKRRVYIAAPGAEKKIDFLVDFPEAPAGISGPGAPEKNAPGPRYAALVRAVIERIAANSAPVPEGGLPDAAGTTAGTTAAGTTLVFTDSRRRAERIAFLINERAGPGAAFAHHGSLARDVRRAVEQRLAGGQLPCVVATASLELGIDIGSAAEVILAGSPGASAAALQRIGRSGHGVGMTSRGRLIPFNGMDLIAAAALAGAVGDREIEETRPVKNPLDILAQIVLALCAERPRHTEALYQTVRGFYAFQTLSRAAYDQVIQMLAGRYEHTRIRELKPRLYLEAEPGDGTAGTLTVTGAVLPLLYSSGGVIANRGYYSMRLGDGTKIGELDEEFVWERRIGDSFDFGGRSWTILAIGSEAVEVAPLERPANYTPFWRADAVFRSAVLTRRILEFFDDVSAETGGKLRDRGFSEAAAAELENFIRRQLEAQGGIPLPGASRLVIEIAEDPPARGDGYSVVLHSFRGGAVHYPLAMALAAEIEAALDTRVEAIPNDNAVLIRLPRVIEEKPETLIGRILRSLGSPGGGGRLRGEGRFRERLQASGIFGANFREAAERSLLLPRTGFGKRTPLWITRQKSKRLFDAAAPWGDFPVLAEAWRSCLEDQFDLRGFTKLLEDLAEGSVELAFFRSREPSPFARELLWRETNALMYQSDERRDLPKDLAAGWGGLSDQVIEEALGNAAARPPLSMGLVSDFTARLRRELKGWAPEDELGLCEWVKERIAVPEDEWAAVLAVLPPELLAALRADPSLGKRLLRLRRPGAVPSVVHREWAGPWEEEALTLLGPWLRYEGPLPLSRITAVFGVSAAEAEAAAEALAEAGELIRDVTVLAAQGPARTPAETPEEPRQRETPGLLCNRENLDLLLRLSRKKARPRVKEQPAPVLTPYLARRQGLLTGSPRGTNGTPGAPLFTPGASFPLAGFSAPAALWETEIFPARFPAYTPETLDRELASGRLLWYGTGTERAGFCVPEDFDLVSAGDPGEPFAVFNRPGLLDVPRDFWEIKTALNLDTAACIKLLWEETWRGRLSADSWEALRRGLETGFKAGNSGETGRARRDQPVYPGRPRRLPRALRDRWKAGPPVPGKWFSLAEDGTGVYGEGDPLEEEALNRDRVRLLLERWGILCRPLLEREAGPLSWARLLPAMRRLELAGELAAGRFFSGVNSLQFAPPAILEELEAAEAEGGIYWMNAADPASPAGLGITGLDPRLPPRIAASRLCFRGPELAALSGRSGRDLEVFIPPEDPALPEVLAFLSVPRTRAVRPRRKIVLETINRGPAGESPYGELLKARGWIGDRGKLILW
jgi:ATP-dependent Lhr-like helicase